MKLLAALLVSCLPLAHAQAGDGDSSQLIANLCQSSTDSRTPYDYAGTQYAPVISQSVTAPLELTVSTTVDGADAFWLHDDDGELIAFQAVDPLGVVTARSATFSIASRAPLVVTAFVHYAADDCKTAQSSMVYTYDGQIDRHYRETIDNYGSSMWPSNITALSTPVVAVDYAARTASVAVTILDDYSVPMVYLRGSGNELLGFGRPGPTPGTVVTYTLSVSNLPQWGTSVRGCAPLGGAEFCTQVHLTADIIAHLRTSSALDPAAFTPPAALASMYSLRLMRPSDAACLGASPPSTIQDYVIWAHRFPEATIAGFSRNGPLRVQVGAAARCPYESGVCLLHVEVLCGTLLRSGFVNVSDLAVAALWEGSGSSGSVTNATGPPRCEDSHPGRDTSWIDPATGELCECFNGVAECSPPADNTIYLTSLEAGGVAGAGAAIVLVLLVFCCQLRAKHQKAMETPLEGGRRRSFIVPLKKDYVRSAKKSRGEEVELPAPPQAEGHEGAQSPVEESLESPVGADGVHAQVDEQTLPAPAAAADRSAV